MASEPPSDAPAEAPPASASDQPQQPQAKPPRTRTSIAFNALVAGTVVLVLLLVFILENTQSVKISYFGASGHLPLGVALLLAAVGGALFVGILGTARVAQIRRHTRRQSAPGRR